MTAEAQSRGDLNVVGIIQEQHPDRCRLFMQWRQMNWPIMVDALNLLGVTVVPRTLFLDEYGIVRAIQPRPEEMEDFLEARYEAPASPPEKSRNSSRIRVDLDLLSGKRGRQSREDRQTHRYSNCLNHSLSHMIPFI